MTNKKYVYMKFKASYYKTHPLSLVMKLESVVDNTGDVYFAVTLSNGSQENEHYMFKKLSSALDFIDCNFK